MKAQYEVDEQFLIEAAQQDPSRFAELYENNFDRVYAFVARRVALREEAEDITSEVFHQALSGLGRYEWRGVPFIAWLLGIAAKLIAKRYQRAANDPQMLADELEEVAMQETTERQTLLSQLVDALPPDQREVVVERFVNQKSIREIANHMQRSEGAVKQLQFRAIQTLRVRVRSSNV